MRFSTSTRNVTLDERWLEADVQVSKSSEDYEHVALNLEEILGINDGMLTISGRGLQNDVEDLWLEGNRLRASLWDAHEGDSDPLMELDDVFENCGGMLRLCSSSGTSACVVCRDFLVAPTAVIEQRDLLATRSAETCLRCAYLHTVIMAYVGEAFYSDGPASIKLQIRKEHLKMSIFARHMPRECILFAAQDAVNRSTLFEGMPTGHKLLGDAFEDDEIPWGLMNQTYKDAIKFCRKIGVRYLWIDSLCIVQDDAEDWAREATKMGEYYGGCRVCIAATSAVSGDAGCNVRQNGTMSFEGTGPDGQPYMVHARPPISHLYDDFEGKLQDTFPLLTRAWVYQERLLSPRVLHFGPSELSLECNESTVCECGQVPWDPDFELLRQAVASHDTGAIVEQDSEARWTNSFVPQHASAEDLEVRLAWDWTDLIETYSALSITYPKDRLPAIAGIAAATRVRRQASGIPPGRYLAGLWESTFMHDLLWQVDPPLVRNSRGQRYASPLPRPKDYIAPSWSWLSILDPIYHMRAIAEVICQLMSVEVAYQNNNVAGTIESGYVRLRGYVRTGMYDAEASKILFDHGEDVPCFPDCGEDGCSESTQSIGGTRGNVHLLAIANREPLESNVPGHDSSKYDTVWLVLRMKHYISDCPCFERIGCTFAHLERANNEAADVIII
ncbi:hypothetical protein LTS14_000786 [Recurvomyces mirabilis]|uniref:uncharacterized protein n=1 Tax=Recurvomyces mirabilis TaxID=574656 RepID=UPI002DE03620|nr:hypothetical protein LTS14_000786 [Recurvomyces mirabilis]